LSVAVVPVRDVDVPCDNVLADNLIFVAADVYDATEREVDPSDRRIVERVE